MNILKKTLPKSKIIFFGNNSDLNHNLLSIHKNAEVNNKKYVVLQLLAVDTKYIYCEVIEEQYLNNDYFDKQSKDII